MHLPGIRWAVVCSALRQILGNLLQVPEISGADARDFGDFLHRLTLTDCGHGLKFDIFSRCVSGCLGGALTLSRQFDGGNLVHDLMLPYEWGSQAARNEKRVPADGERLNCGHLPWNGCWREVLLSARPGVVD